MELEEFATELSEAGGVKDSQVKDGKLYLTYFANPSNYATKRGEIRDNYPEIDHVDTKTNSSGHTTLIYEKI